MLITLAIIRPGHSRTISRPWWLYNLPKVTSVGPVSLDSKAGALTTVPPHSFYVKQLCCHSFLELL